MVFLRRLPWSTNKTYNLALLDIIVAVCACIPTLVRLQQDGVKRSKMVAALLENRVNCCQSRVLKFILTAIVLLGGFLYWVGGIQLAKSINDVGSNFDKSHKYHYSGWAGAVFIGYVFFSCFIVIICILHFYVDVYTTQMKATFVALTAIVLGIDYLSNFLKNDRIRTYLVLNTVLGFTALVAFFSYAAWRAYGVSGLSMSRTACVSAGWFFVLVACIYLYVIGFAEICCKVSATAQREIREKPGKIKTGAIVVLLFGGFIVMVGMWSIATLSDKYWNCYYAGYGFFVFFFCLLLALDVHLGEVIQRRFQR
ncbi:hypothetical protein RFI_24391 [Reticulomyxa filosa]|uniref:Uncharacterized protein n=1 Tax=Reticulomyxa filosa TaxID=46433 RepID=X6MIU9_RETFI|nr:hypothetical protein RFI_24391 [Reticulomyxa filosa]|eukprot:ETO12985.1 hypothetical protein RFI_24391 [Reticulomyxa filosa]